jgi:hypothetical protein
MSHGQVTLDQAIAEAEHAIAAVELCSDREWSEQALEAVHTVALKQQTFISDDVWDTGLPSTREDRALGPIFRRAAALGWIQRTDRTRPSRRSHGSGKPLWESLLCKREGN